MCFNCLRLYCLFIGLRPQQTLLFVVGPLVCTDRSAPTSKEKEMATLFCFILLYALLRCVKIE